MYVECELQALGHHLSQWESFLSCTCVNASWLTLTKMYLLNNVGHKSSSVQSIPKQALAFALLGPDTCFRSRKIIWRDAHDAGPVCTFDVKFKRSASICQQWESFLSCVNSNWHTLTYARVYDDHLNKAGHKKSIETKPESAHVVRDMARKLGTWKYDKAH